ncbi:segregation and condensation protein A [Gracilibacillus boraciitolerans JCM 21714]|uniref:Segregation and condensation protein A n=1 Tax=Gracilibacillus boraciitolerans JCM 21714 TaxID=1298598 RepID=W4VDM3_9BACI|nr:segregation/condensation protein A [Gracilibacillus boraciitolerans]GAE91312.1 segregation and condensation protein A [Gracilibacillus boraciitolerans JCM 21714]
MLNHYQVKLETFEGPLDLLLHLINKYEIDIYDIPVSEITLQYMNYIHTMQQLELNIASEYLVMAATLLEIKSKLLLPNPTVEMEEEYEEDPREELMSRLIEYRKYKEAAEHLQQREIEQSQIHTRPPAPFSTNEKPILPEGAANIYDMIEAISKVMERRKWNRPMETSVQRQEIPIDQRMDEIMKKIDTIDQPISFYELFSNKTRTYIVATFIAILELMKQKKINCKQESNLDELFIYRYQA